jgi:hypothetical protein
MKDALICIKIKVPWQEYKLKKKIKALKNIILLVRYLKM